MCASAAARGLSWTPLAKGPFRPSTAGEDTAHWCGREVTLRSIRDILRQSGNTVSRISNDTGKRYGSRSHYFIPPTFLYTLHRGVTPHVCQIVALSASTGYRFVDWMRLFGFDVRRIPTLQVQMHPERTVLITPIEFETASFQSPLFQTTSSPAWTIDGSSRPGDRLEDLRAAGGRYWFAKIGSRDALASCLLPPGTIVRVDRWFRRPIRGSAQADGHNLLWLVEHPGGLTCCQVKWIDDRQIVMLPSRPPWGSLPLCIPTEARILGLVDLQRGSLKPGRPQAGYDPAKREPPVFPYLDRQELRFPELLRAARCRTGLTFRAARDLTCSIARRLTSRDYAISLGLLSDYEAMGKLPRHVAKIISLCIAYCLDIRQLMEAAGVSIDDSDKMPLPLFAPLVPSDPDFHATSEPYQTIGLGTGYAQSEAAQFERISGI
jgi:hypothetical protein